MTTATTRYPTAGDRVGVIDGPGQDPRDSAGTVLATYADRWHQHIAVVLMDSGATAEIVGTYTTAGIGWHLIKPATP